MARKKRKKKEKSSSDTHEQTQELLAMLHETEDKGIVQQIFTETSEIDDNLVQSPPPPAIDSSTPPPPPPAIDSSAPPPIAQEEQKKKEKTTSTFFTDTGVFFNQLGEAYEARYALWEKSDLTLMAILREVRKINDENTDKFVEVIEDLDNKISSGFNEFLVKRNELERYSDTDYKEIAKNFQKTLDLLNFQIREFRLNQMVTELYEIYSN